LALAVTGQMIAGLSRRAMPERPELLPDQGSSDGSKRDCAQALPGRVHVQAREERKHGECNPGDELRSDQANGRGLSETALEAHRNSLLAVDPQRSWFCFA
jgi:hypothetical protein